MFAQEFEKVAVSQGALGRAVSGRMFRNTKIIPAGEKSKTQRFLKGLSKNTTSTRALASTQPGGNKGLLKKVRSVNTLTKNKTFNHMRDLRSQINKMVAG